jgi:hypothetical protein
MWIYRGKLKCFDVVVQSPGSEVVVLSQKPVINQTKLVGVHKRKVPQDLKNKNVCQEPW